MSSLPEDFNDLTEQQLRRLATDEGVMARLFFATNDSLLLTLLGAIGSAYNEATTIEQRLRAYDLHEKVGLVSGQDPAHQDFDNSLEAAVEAVKMAFDIVVTTQLLSNDLEKNCKCMNCIRRRQIKVADDQ